MDFKHEDNGEGGGKNETFLKEIGTKGRRISLSNCRIVQGVIFFGNKGVGKSSLIGQYLSFFKKRDIKKEITVDFQCFKLKRQPLILFDDFNPQILNSYGINHFVLIFSLSDRKSFDDIRLKWAPLLSKNKNYSKILVANQTHKRKENCILEEEIKTLAQEIDAKEYIIISTFSFEDKQNQEKIKNLLNFALLNC